MIGRTRPRAEHLAEHVVILKDSACQKLLIKSAYFHMNFHNFKFHQDRLRLSEVMPGGHTGYTR